MKFRLLAAVAALALASAARAETLAFPSEAPVVSVTFPDGWRTEETETGAQSFSADNSIFLYADLATDGESLKEVVVAAASFLRMNGVTVDPSSQSSANGDVNGWPAKSVAWTGTDESGAVDVEIIAVFVSEKDIVVFTYWASEGAGETHSAELATITSSVQPVSN